MTDGQRINTIQSKRQVVNNIFTSPGLGVHLIAKKDPKRVYIRFQPYGADTMHYPFPGPVPDGYSGVALTSHPQEFKLNDCAGMVTGEWYVFTLGGTQTMLITEELYVGK